MDNQDSSPALTFPNVPIDFCPTGNWSEVLQEFIDVVLSNGTISVPGLGDVTPTEIANINQDIQNLQNQVDALDTIQIRRGVLTLIGLGDSTKPITFDTDMPDNDYTVSLTAILPSSPITAASPNIFLLNGTKAVSGFTVAIENNGVSPATPTITSIEWLAIYSA
jgi:hypothetical protein